MLNFPNPPPPSSGTSTETNILFYVDLRGKEGPENNCKSIMEKKMPAKEKFLSIFRTAILCETDLGYEWWVQPPWSHFKRINNLTMAYFNRKPNLHGLPFSFLTSWSRFES